MEKKEIAGSSQPLSIRSIVLPAIPDALRTSWNLNSERLRKAGMFTFLTWIQTILKVAYADKVIQFVQTRWTDYRF
jgi:hypothetical protein